MTRYPAFAAVVAGLMVMSSPALAATTATLALPLAHLLAILFGSALAIFSVLVLARRSQVADHLNRARSAGAYGTAVLQSAESAFLTIHDNAGFYCSDRLRDWLSLPFAPTTLNDLAAATEYGALTTSQWHLLAGEIENLRNSRRPFDLTLTGQSAIEAVAVKGRRIDDPTLGGMVLVWFRLDDSATGTGPGATVTATRLRALLDAAPVPIWMRDDTMRLIEVNRAYADAVEQSSPGRVVAEGVELLPAALQGGGHKGALKALETALPQVEKHYAVVHGERRALAIHDVPIDEGGFVRGIAGFAIDVTDLEEVDAELRRNLEAHAETLNKLLTPVAIYGPDKRLQFYNNAFAELWALSEDWLQSNPGHGEILEAMRVSRRLPEQADFPAWKRQQLDRYTTILEELEELWHLPDGATFRVVTKPHPMGGLLVLYEDVTDRLALERSYNTLIAVQRETLNNLLEAVGVFGSDHRLQLFNSNFAAFWDLPHETLGAGPHFGDILDLRPEYRPGGLDQEGWKSEWINRIALREANTGRWSMPDGRVFDYAAVPLPDGAALLTLQDMTASVRIEQALRERNFALEAADRLKSEFVANVSYELRTPLNSIMGFTEILKNEYFGGMNEKQHEYVDSVMEASSVLRELINDILELAVIEAGEVELELETITVSDLIAGVAGMSIDMARKSKQTIDVRCPDDLGDMVADKRRVQQALYNLISNAIQNATEPGTIILSAAATETEIRLSVHDRMTDQTAEELQSELESFGTGRQSAHNKRLGVGMTLVRRFVDMHGGRIEVHAVPDEGATITCVLPRTANPQDDPAPA